MGIRSGGNWISGLAAMIYCLVEIRRAYLEKIKPVMEEE